MEQDEVLTQWRLLCGKAEDLAKQCRADPTQAPMLGVEQMIDYGDDRPLFGIQPASRPYNEKASWLRGAATAIMPAEFRWEVKEMVGGNCALILLGWERRSTPTDSF